MQSILILFSCTTGSLPQALGPGLKLQHEETVSKKLLHMHLSIERQREKENSTGKWKNIYREGWFPPDLAQHPHSHSLGRESRLTTPATGCTSTMGSAEMQRDIWELMKPQMS